MREILETDRTWSAYALADLRPPWREHARWISLGHSVVMIYAGLSPPVLFAHGNPAELDALFAQVPEGEYWFTLRPTDYSRIAPRLSARERMRMWRMWLPDPADAPWEAAPFVERLGEADLPAVEHLFGRVPDGPDAFHPSQLTRGVFFGIRAAQGLLSVAGTHVLSGQLSIAALGNVATLPEQRGRGLARAALQAVLAELRNMKIETVVLNVRMDNRPAIQFYERLGFLPYCGFYEGRGTIHSNDR